MTVEDRLIAWREAEQAAAAAEQAVAALGQTAADPRARELFLRAGELREQADRKFAAILRAVKLDDHRDNRGESANERQQSGSQGAGLG